ncbi:peptidase [Raphidocelis subcapitata]|uniref:Serine protease n=1 Tax=Raphidocelis subcapitata TaxID=307507 RepID=A0A2V0PDF1_9CHLO|nr:peptidase [Raphidocelis subcapitata]|eukprot:GBF97874.1 peptidase [Raphidocelis subcapitata]
MQPRQALAALAVALVVFLAATAPARADPDADTAPAKFDCARGCTFTVAPVCGSDGEWYQNECLAFCSGDVHAAEAQVCNGTTYPFMSNRPGPAGAESAGGSDAVPPSVLTRFAAEGFKFVGRIRLSHEMGPRPEPADKQPAPKEDGDSHWRVKAVRCTAEGDVYIGSMKIPKNPLSLESYMPPWMTAPRARVNSTLLQMASSLGLIPPPVAPRAGAGANASGAADGGGKERAGRLGGLLGDFRSLFASPAALQRELNDTAAAAAAASAPLAAGSAARRRRRLAQARALSELVGGDDRTDCERGFPYTAIGQIQIVDNTGLYICTGTLIAADKVLTAGHCVWNIKRGAFYYNLNYAPGRYREDGNVVNPWGVVPWKSVTVFDSFKQNPSTWDVAVVTLARPLGSLTGYMGIAAGCGRNLQLQTAGYPQDKATGTCMASSCLQRTLDCESPVNPHTCDTIMGMSGSPLWDAKNRIRLIHVAGIEGRAENRATTLTQFLVNTVTQW